MEKADFSRAVETPFPEMVIGNPYHCDWLELAMLEFHSVPCKVHVLSPLTNDAQAYPHENENYPGLPTIHFFSFIFLFGQDIKCKIASELMKV